MKKTMMTLLVMTFMTMSSYAQYYNDYATQVMINAQQRWALQEQMFWMQHQMAMNQAAQQIQQQMAQNWSIRHQMPTIPVPSWTPSSSNGSYESGTPAQSTSSKRTREARCTNCLGRGFNPKTMYTGNGHVITTQIRCSFCHGNGKVTETYYE